MTAIIKNFFKGIVFSISGAIPAVSGGTIALIFGFYNELLESLSRFTQNWKKYLKFLLPLLFGIICGLILFSSIMHHLLVKFSFPAMMFFIGLIAGSIPLIYLKINKQEKAAEGKPVVSIKEIICILIPTAVLFIISNFRAASVTNTAEVIKNINLSFMLYLILVGIVSGSFLIIPGVSGVLFQLIMGVYPLVIYSISSVRIFLIDITNTSLLLDIIKVLTPMAIGILFSSLFMARLIEKLLKNHYRAVYCVILGILFGSIYLLFKEPLVYQSGVSLLIIAAGVITFLLGGVTSFFIGRMNLSPAES